MFKSLSISCETGTFPTSHTQWCYFCQTLCCFGALHVQSSATDTFPRSSRVWLLDIQVPQLMPSPQTQLPERGPPTHCHIALFYFHCGTKHLWSFVRYLSSHPSKNISSLGLESFILLITTRSSALRTVPGTHWACSKHSEESPPFR